MTLQEIFNIVWERAKDKTRAYSNGCCMYRLHCDPKGCRCFIGALIPDDKYIPEMDNGYNLRNVLKYTGIDYDDENLVFCNTLRAVHDGRDVEEWEGELRSIAEEYCLSVPA